MTSGADGGPDWGGLISYGGAKLSSYVKEKFDTDGDGEVTIDEVMGGVKGIISRFGAGEVSLTKEIQKFVNAGGSKRKEQIEVDEADGSKSSKRMRKEKTE